MDIVRVFAQECARFIGAVAVVVGIAALMLALVALRVEAKTCTIVVAVDRPSTMEIYHHELAHCNGWKHADQGHHGKPKQGYVSPKPPAKYIRPYKGHLDSHFVTTREALTLCESYGCQWFQ